MIRFLSAVFFFVFISFNISVSAQTRAEDSLQQAFNKATTDTLRIRLLSELTDACELKDVLKYADKCVTLCEKGIAAGRVPQLFYFKYLANVFANIGYYHSKHGNVDKALDYYQKSLKLFETLGDRRAATNLLNNIAFIYDNQGYVSRALEFFYKDLKVQEEIRDTMGAAYSLNNIGYVYINQHDYKQALSCYVKCLKMYQSINDKKGIALALHNTGLVYSYQKDLPKSLYYYNKSLKMNEARNDYVSVSNTLNNIGDVYIKMGDDVKAQDYFNRSLAIAEKYQFKDVVAVCMISLADLLIKNGNLNKAEDYALRSLQIAKEIGNPLDIRNAAGTLKKVYKKQNKFKEAYGMLEMEMQMRDSVLNEANKKESVRQELQYEYEKKELQSQLVQERKLSAIKLENERRLTHKNILMYLLISLAVILCLSIFYLYKFFQQKNIINANKNSELRQKLLLSQMNPHFIFNSVDNIQSLIHNKQDKEAISYLTKFSKLTRQILENSTENYITLQEELNMTENYLTIQQLLYNNNFTFNIEVDADLETETVLLPPMLTQPFIENAIKHGLKNKTEGGFIRVRFYMKEKLLFFEVTDNGAGLQVSETKGDHKSMATQIVNQRLNDNPGKKVIAIDTRNIVENNTVKGVSTRFEIPYICEN